MNDDITGQDVRVRRSPSGVLYAAVMPADARRFRIALRRDQIEFIDDPDTVPDDIPPHDTFDRAVFRFPSPTTEMQVCEVLDRID